MSDGGDAYILAQILHDWDDERCLVILDNCRRAMQPNAKVLVVEQVLRPGNEPSFGKWLDLHTTSTRLSPALPVDPPLLKQLEVANSLANAAGDAMPRLERFGN